MLRQATTDAALEQRHFLDLMQSHERERPYPLPTFAATHRRISHDQPRSAGTPASTGLKYASLGKSSYAKKQAKQQQTSAFWRSSRDSPTPGLSICTCPRCQTVHIHRDPVHNCSCGLTLHRQKQLTLTQRQPASTQAGKGQVGSGRRQAQTLSCGLVCRGEVTRLVCSHNQHLHTPGLPGSMNTRRFSLPPDRSTRVTLRRLTPYSNCQCPANAQTAGARRQHARLRPSTHGQIPAGDFPTVNLAALGDCQ